MDKLNSNDIIMDFGDIKIRLFENYNETKIDKILRTAKSVIISRSRIVNKDDKDENFRGMLNIADSTLTIHENDFDKLDIITSDGITNITKALLELSDIATTPLDIEPFIFSKKDDYYNISLDIVKYDYEITVANITEPATVTTDSTCKFEPSIKFQEHPLLNRDDTTGEKGWLLIKNNDMIRLYDSDAKTTINNAIINMYREQSLNYRCITTIKTYYSITNADVQITLNKKSLKHLLELFRLQYTQPITTVLGTLQFINDEATLIYKSDASVKLEFKQSSGFSRFRRKPRVATHTFHQPI